MKNFLLPVSLLPVIFLVACGGTPEEQPLVVSEPLPEVAEPDPLNLTWENLKADTTAENSLIVMEGYIGDIGSYVTSSNGQYTIPVYERRNQGGGTHLSVYLSIGSRANNVEALPDNFSPADYKIYCDDSTIVTAGDKVRVTATLYNSVTEGYYFADGVKVEAMEDHFDAALFEQAVPLTDAIMADTANKSVYCYITGKFVLPSLIFSLDNGISLDLKNSSVKEITAVSVPVSADRPSSMNDLPDNYTSKDLIIRDYMGQVIPANTTVKIYGLWDVSTIYANEKSRVFYPEEIARN